MSNNVGFNVTVFYNKPENATQYIGNFIEDSLSFGGKCVVYIPNNKPQIVYYDQSSVKIALKIAAYILTLGIFPLVMLYAKVIYRALSDFKIEKDPAVSTKHSAKMLLQLTPVLLYPHLFQT